MYSNEVPKIRPMKRGHATTLPQLLLLQPVQFMLPCSIGRRAQQPVQDGVPTATPIEAQPQMKHFQQSCRKLARQPGTYMMFPQLPLPIMNTVLPKFVEYSSDDIV